MRHPIIIDENGDITVYSTAQEAERAMEAIDVRNGEYKAYDADAFCLDLAVVDDRMSIFGTESVRLRYLPDALARPAELQQALARFLVAIGHDRNEVQGAPLDKLIAAVQAGQNKS
jgi:hypothetical protein